MDSQLVRARRLWALSAHLHQFAVVEPRTADFLRHHISMPVVPSIGFYGRTEDALDFYRSVLGAETVFLMRFADSPLAANTPASAMQLVFHATFRIEGSELMANDVGYDDPPTDGSQSSVGFVLQLKSADRGREIYGALADQGKAMVPLTSTDFTPLYGVVVDQFGVTWIINVDPERR